MLPLVLLAVTIVIGIIEYFTDNSLYKSLLSRLFVAKILLLITLISAIMIPIWRMSVYDNMIQMQAAENTVYSLRKQATMENMTMSEEIVKWNTLLARYQYYNANPIFDWYIPDTVILRTPI